MSRWKPVWFVNRHGDLVTSRYIGARNTLPSRIKLATNVAYNAMYFAIRHNRRWWCYSQQHNEPLAIFDNLEAAQMWLILKGRD